MKLSETALRCLRRIDGTAKACGGVCPSGHIRAMTTALRLKRLGLIEEAPATHGGQGWVLTDAGRVAAKE